MDRHERSVISMHIRRLSDGDKAQYIPHFAEARELTVGKYQEWVEDTARKAAALGSLWKHIKALREDEQEDAEPSLSWGSMTIPVITVGDAPAVDHISARLDMARFNIAAQMGIPSHLLGRNDK